MCTKCSQTKVLKGWLADSKTKDDVVVILGRFWIRQVMISSAQRSVSSARADVCLGDALAHAGVL